MIAPCLWLSRVHAGDLSSHLYNAWLAQLVTEGKAEGLAIEPQLTNALLDRLLGVLLPWIGVTGAGRVAVALSVLIFGWGAFAFIRALSDSLPWRVMPIIVMLANGWVLQSGLLNFYISLGLCFWGMALCWRPSLARLAAAAPLALAALTAHALPVFWAAGMTAYVWLARRLPPRARTGLMASAIACVALVRMAASARFATRWTPLQLVSSLGVDQLWVFGPTFALLALVLLLLLLLPLLRFLESPAWKPAENFPAQVCVLTAVTIAVMPNGILLPGYRHALAYIADRMSLALAVCICAMLGAVPWRRFEKIAAAALACVFFACLYADQRAVDRFEDRMELALSRLPAGSRVVAAFNPGFIRVNPLTHVVDRACIGRCFSYGNYEPSTASFRLRAIRPNQFVAFRYEDSWDLQNGGYVVRESDPPLLEASAGQQGAPLTVRQLKSGERTQVSNVRILPF